MTSEDDDEFRRAMADVRPLRVRKHVPPVPRPRPVARSARAGREDVLQENDRIPSGAAAAHPGDELLFRRAGVRDDVLRRLRRGRFAIEAEIDLHGLGRHAAHAALREFLNDSVHRGLRCVRVIHGKGLRSGPGGPVLKHVVDLWLRRIENVVAFATARPVDGGTGAVCVLLGPVETIRRR